MKAGFKQTEVGEIPEDWEVKSIAEVAPLQRGFDLPTRLISGGNYPVAYSNGIQNHHSAYMVKGPGVFTGRSGTIGKVHYIENDYWPHNTSLWVTSFKKNIPKYIYYLIGSIRVEKFSGGSGVPTLNRNDVHDCLVCLPKPDEQKKIADALSDVDALIGSLEKLIIKKRDMKTAAMQQLLTGKKRLPGFKKRWQHTEIRSYIDLLTGFPFPSSGYVSSGVRLLRGSNIKRGQLDWSDDIIKFWPNIDAEVTKYSLKKGDIVIAMDGSLVGRSFGQISKSDLPALLLQRVARVRSSDIEQDFLKEWICSPLFTEHCDNVKTVTAIPHISPEDILKFEIDVPEDLAEQKAIASFLADASSELLFLENRLTKTKAIKQGMMQELLTGRTRLV